MKDITRRGSYFGTATLGAYGITYRAAAGAFGRFADDRPSQANADSGPVTSISLRTTVPCCGGTLPKVKKSDDGWRSNSAR